MIKARHSRIFQSLFGWYLSGTFRRHFHAMEILGEVKDMGLPILAIANHVSWWDGFWMLHLNHKTFRRRFHVMMLEEQLSKNRFLSKLGAFSIRKKSKSATETIRYAVDLLSNSENLVLVFPQGRIQSQYTFPLIFDQGWERMLVQSTNPVQILFAVNLLDYGSNSKPTLRQYFYCPGQDMGIDCETLEQHYNDFYRQCLEQQMKLKL